jgi:hypothetical protein
MDEEVGTLKKLANAELMQSLAGFDLRGLLQTLDRFLGHFVSPLLVSFAPLGRCLPICKWRANRRVA